MSGRGRIISAMVALLVVLALGMAGCAGPKKPEPIPANSPRVVEGGFVFDPDVLKVKVGQTVVFVNEDTVPHEVKIDGEVLGPQQKGDTVTWKADKIGSYPYVCTVHPSMIGTVVVE
jgi:plastocyanin